MSGFDAARVRDANPMIATSTCCSTNVGSRRCATPTATARSPTARSAFATATIAWSARSRDVPRERDRDACDRCAGAAGRRRASSIATRTSSTRAIARGEFERRLEGVSYADIARAGGGIASTVAATRAASDATRSPRRARRALAAMIDEGATTVEIKSGYGLDTANELKQLRVARALGAALDVDVRTTLLAAHALPPEFAGRADAYIDYVCGDTIPAAAREGLADAVDAFCETIGFTARADASRVRGGARARSAGQAARRPAVGRRRRALAAEFGALSADHLEYTNERGHRGDGAGRDGRRAAARRVLCAARNALAAGRRRCARMACRSRSATDCNPGTSPATSLPLMMNMACTLFRLTPSEALAGVTRQRGARARPRGSRHARPSGSAPTSRCGTSTSRPSSRTASAREACAGVIRAGRDSCGSARLTCCSGTSTRGDSPLIVSVPHAGRTFPMRSRCGCRRGARRCPTPTGMSTSCTASRRRPARRCSSRRIRATSST